MPVEGFVNSNGVNRVIELLLRTVRVFQSQAVEYIPNLSERSPALPVLPRRAFDNGSHTGAESRFDRWAGVFE